MVHGHDTRDHCVYDLDGHPSQMSIGALLETMAIAASTFALEMRAIRHTDTPDTRPTFSIDFLPSPGMERDPLADAIQARSVQRRALSRRPLTPAEKSALNLALPAGYRVRWLEGPQRLAAARLMFRNARLRLTMPEAHRVHQSVIEWNARYSEDRIPDQALGADAMTTRLMRWVLQDWRRVHFFNTWLAGTLPPSLQMDLIPGLACAAHFLLVAEHGPHRIDDYVAAGRAMQRFWLTATALGLQLQPEMTPLIFTRYVREGRVFSATSGMQEQALRVSRQGEALAGQQAWDAAGVLGRLGAGRAARARSLRRPLRDLLVAPGGA